MRPRASVAAPAGWWRFGGGGRVPAAATGTPAPPPPPGRPRLRATATANDDALPPPPACRAMCAREGGWGHRRGGVRGTTGGGPDAVTLSR